MPPYKASTPDTYINAYLEDPVTGYCPGDMWELTEDFESFKPEWHRHYRTYSLNSDGKTLAGDEDKYLKNPIDPEYAGVLGKLRNLHEVKDIQGFFCIKEMKAVLPKKNIAEASALIKRFSASVTSHQLGGHIKASLGKFGDFLPISHWMPYLGIHEVVLARIGDVKALRAKKSGKTQVQWLVKTYRRESRFVRSSEWIYTRLPMDQPDREEMAQQLAIPFTLHWDYFVNFERNNAARISAALGVPLDVIELLKRNHQEVAQADAAYNARLRASQEASRLESERYIAQLNANTNANIQRAQAAYVGTFVAAQYVAARGDAAFNNTYNMVRDENYRAATLDNANAHLNEIERHNMAMENIVSNY